jgi:hypothetical protein
LQKLSNIKKLLGTGHYLSPGGGKKVGKVMKKMEIDRGGTPLFWLINQGIMICFKHTQ